MADQTQSKPLKLVEEGVDVTNCWKQSRPTWHKLRMENIRLCWMLRTWTPVLLIALVFFNLLLAALTLAAPTQHSVTSPPTYDTTTIDHSYATTQTEENGDTFVHEPPTATYDPTKPRELLFLKNANCKLHKADGRTTARSCGLRELDLPNNNSGVRYWNPQTCRSSHCQCVPTKEIRRREKRTIANNKTEIEYRRFRVFECV